MISGYDTAKLWISIIRSVGTQCSFLLLWYPLFLHGYYSSLSINQIFDIHNHLKFWISQIQMNTKNYAKIKTGLSLTGNK